MYGAKDATGASPDHRAALPVFGSDRDGGGGWGAVAAPASSHSLASSTSSFFSLANSTGFRSPLNDGSGQRTLLGAHSSNMTTTSSANADMGGAAPRLFSQVRDEERGGPAQEVPIAHPKASRPRLSQTPPMANVPGFATISTRGGQRHHLAFSESPSPPPSPARTAATTTMGNLSGAPSPIAASAESDFYTSSSRETGYPLGGLFTSFGQPPSQRLASRLTPTDGPAHKSGLINSMGALFASTSPTLSSTDLARGTSPSKEAGSPARKDSLQCEPEKEISNSSSSYTRRSARAIPDLATSSAAQKHSGASPPLCHPQRLRESGNSQGLSSTPPAHHHAHEHRYHEADEEAGNGGAAASAAAAALRVQHKNATASTPPPDSHEEDLHRVSHADKTFALAASHTVTDCTTREDRPHNPVRLRATPRTTLTKNPLLRRSSVSAAPFVPAAWHPAAKQRRATTTTIIADATTPTSVTAPTNGLGQSYEPSAQKPVLAMFTPLKDPSRNLAAHASKAVTTGMQQPSVRFIYTRSGSTSKAASPDRSLPIASDDNCELPSPAIVLTTSPKQKGTAKKKSAVDYDQKSKGGANGFVFSTLRRNTAPSLTEEDHNTRRPAASVPFARSATFAGVSEKKTRVNSREEPPETNNGVSRRQRSLVQGAEAPTSSSGRGSRGSFTDFDAAPQSYLMQWRQRQEEKRMRDEKKREGPTVANVASMESSAPAKIQKDVKEEGSGMPLTAPSPPAISESAAAPCPSSPPAQPIQTVPEAGVVMPKEVRPQLSAPATNSSWKHVREEPAAPPTFNALSLTESATPMTKKVDNTSEKANETSSKSHSAYSLSDALCSSNLPAAAAPGSSADGTMVKTKKTKEELPASVDAGPPPPSKTDSAALTHMPAQLEEAKLSETQLASTMKNTTLVTPQLHAAPSDSTLLTAPSLSSSAMASPSSPSPHHSSGRTRKASQASSGSYQTEDYVRRASVEEAIPEEQVLTRSLPTSLSEKTTSAAPHSSQVSPRRPAKTDSVQVVAAVKASNESVAASKPPSAVASVRSSCIASARTSTALPPSTPPTAREEGSTEGTPSGKDVRDLCRIILERREQRLQKQQQSESARHRSSARDTPQLRISTPPPQLENQQQQQPSTGNTGVGLTDTVDASRSSSRLGTASACRTATGMSSPYTPPWKVGLTGGVASNSRPPSTAPEATKTETKTTPAATTTPATEPVHARTGSLAAVALPPPQKSALPSRCTTPSSVTGTAASTARDGRTSAVAAVSETAGDDEEAMPSRVSQLLARRSSFASRLSLSVDGTAALVATASPALVSPPGSTKDEAAPPCAGASTVPVEAAMPSLRHTAETPAASTSASHKAVAAASLPLSFNMAAAMESIPTAADIEREARMAEKALVSVEPSHLTNAAPKDDMASVKANDKGETSVVKGTAAVREDIRAAPLVEAQPRPMISFAAHPPPPPPVEATGKSAVRSPPPGTSAPPPVVLTSTRNASSPSKTTTAPAAAVATLGEIQVDELDKLEQSVNAMLKQYGKSAVHSTPDKGETPSKLTAADLLLSQMPKHAETTTKMKKKAAAATRVPHTKPLRAASMEMSGSASRHHAFGSEWEDEDPHWDASLLWCGEESDGSEAALPSCVPPLDLTILQLPTNEYEDLKPYRIPLPSAVPVPEENYRRLLKLAGLASTSPPSLEANQPSQDDRGARRGSSTVRRRSSGLFNASSSFTSSQHSRNSLSLADVSPVLGERIRAMKEQPAEPPAALAAARKLRLSRRTSLASATVANTTVRDENVGRRTAVAQPLLESLAEEEEAEGAEDSIHELVDEAPQRISRVVRFTDDSDALDGGRGAARDIRVGQQNNRVRGLLLDCEEQRERKVVQAEEQGAFAVICKSFRRSSLLT